MERNISRVRAIYQYSDKYINATRKIYRKFRSYLMRERFRELLEELRLMNEDEKSGVNYFS